MRKYEVTEYDMSDYDDFKNNLTPEHTITILEYIDRGYLPDYNFTGTEMDFEYHSLHCAMRMAIESLSKK